MAAHKLVLYIIVVSHNVALINFFPVLVEQAGELTNGIGIYLIKCIFDITQISNMDARCCFIHSIEFVITKVTIDPAAFVYTFATKLNLSHCYLLSPGTGSLGRG